MNEHTTPAVRFDHVTTVLGGRLVLDDVSLDVARGEAVCVLGKSGTGKSVTLKTIMGLMVPDAGRVFVEGHEVTDASREELSEIRQHLGFLFQNAALFDSISVGENVAFALRRHTDLADDEIDELLCGLRDTQDTTLIVVTHNIPSARKVARRLMVLDQGRIVAEGTAEELDRSELPLVREFMRSKGSG